jgi:aminomethyltransferase
MGEPGELKTPLTAWHEAHGGKMASFGGYLMPMEYSGILAEHRAVREATGLFDVSHMTEFFVEGSQVGDELDHLVTNWPGRLETGQALYTPMCREDGGTVDDLLIYRLASDRWLLVTNAANHDGDWHWVLEHTRDSLPWRDASREVALIAVQGPLAVETLRRLGAGDSILSLGSYRAVEGASVAGRETILVSRTGYTGEDGFEIYVANDAALPLWQALVDAGALPAGLGARDTLRLEARLPLYGHELTLDINPLEAGLASFVKWDKPGGFIGREALLDVKTEGPRRRLAGLLVEQGIARAGAPVGRGDDAGGVVTSGTFSPTLKRAVALALLPRDWTKVGTSLWCEVRGRRLPAEVVRLPFYRRTPAGAPAS